MVACFMCPLGTLIYEMQRKCTTHPAFKSSLPLPSRWPSSSTSPTSSSAWCGGGAWTLTTSLSPTWRPWGTCWAPAFLPCASAASRCSRAWVSELRSPPNQPTTYRQLTVSFRPFSYICTEMLSMGQWRTWRWSLLQRFIRRKSVTNSDLYRNAETTPTHPSRGGFCCSKSSVQLGEFSTMCAEHHKLDFGIIPLYQFDRFLFWHANWIWDQLMISLDSSEECVATFHQGSRTEAMVRLHCASVAMVTKVDICSTHTGRFSDVGQICLSHVLNLHEKSGYVTNRFVISLYGHCHCNLHSVR